MYLPCRPCKWVHRQDLSSLGQVSCSNLEHAASHAAGFTLLSLTPLPPRLVAPALSLRGYAVSHTTSAANHGERWIQTSDVETLSSTCTSSLLHPGCSVGQDMSLNGLYSPSLSVCQAPNICGIFTGIPNPSDNPDMRRISTTCSAPLP